MKNLDKVKDQYFRDKFEESHELISQLNLSEEVKEDLFMILQESIDRHLSIQESFEKTVESVVRLDEANKKQISIMSDIKKSLETLNKELKVIVALQNVKEVVEA